MTTGSGIAVAAMWVAVGLIGNREPLIGLLIGALAVMATAAVVSS